MAAAVARVVPEEFSDVVAEPVKTGFQVFDTPLPSLTYAERAGLPFVLSARPPVGPVTCPLGVPVTATIGTLMGDAAALCTNSGAVTVNPVPENEARVASVLVAIKHQLSVSPPATHPDVCVGAADDVAPTKADCRYTLPAFVAICP